ncbi:hypothetical protein [Kocuria rosea]|uniref:hypothetical protein n=1 Tax=Kocuria rosea TaxID=1275 RepID=UPI002B252E33|nr:hypothetical protein [Kocuria rosea]MEB2527833.1 hypothetical protein [Kocuria rosea]MEB2617717.1 hypothetical protein [Kocuria rosea]
MSVTTTPRPFGTPARPADWLTIDEGQLYEGPEFRNRDDEFGIKLMWTPDEIRFGLSSDTSTDMLTRAELLGLRSSIDKALRAESKLNS